jgi:uncharacterized protein YwgA
MKSAGVGDGDGYTRCPKCKQFVERVHMMAFRVDELHRKIRDIEQFLADNEWVFIENAEKMKQIQDLNDVDMESFDLTCRQIIRFNRYIDKVTRTLNQMNNEGENFERGSED